MSNWVEQASLYGSEDEYWSQHPLVHPLRWLKDPYALEREHYQDRPYPITSPAFSNVPLIGPLLAATIGKLIKPPVTMHEDEWDRSSYSLYSTRLEPRGGLDAPEPQPEFSFSNAMLAEAKAFSEFIGLQGFVASSAYSRLVGNDDLGEDVYLQGSRQMTNFSRRYYERELGAIMGLDPGEHPSRLESCILVSYLYLGSASPPRFATPATHHLLTPP